MSTDDKRGTTPPLPPDVKRLLTVDQVVVLKRLEGFGWRVKFVRRPLFQQVIVVVTSYDGKELGVLESDGRLNMNPDIKLREAIAQGGLQGKTPSTK